MAGRYVHRVLPLDRRNEYHRDVTDSLGGVIAISVDRVWTLPGTYTVVDGAALADGSVVALTGERWLAASSDSRFRSVAGLGLVAVSPARSPANGDGRRDVLRSFRRPGPRMCASSSSARDAGSRPRSRRAHPARSVSPGTMRTMGRRDGDYRRSSR
jgi:hypothetical protein